MAALQALTCFRKACCSIARRLQAMALRCVKGLTDVTQCSHTMLRYLHCADCTLLPCMQNGPPSAHQALHRYVVKSSKGSLGMRSDLALKTLPPRSMRPTAGASDMSAGRWKRMQVICGLAPSAGGGLSQHYLVFRRLKLEWHWTSGRNTGRHGRS